MHPHREALPLCDACPPQLLAASQGRRRQDSSIRAPSAPAQPAPLAGAGPGPPGCSRLLSRRLSPSRTRRRQYSTPRVWGMNSKYGALDFFFNLVSFPLICVLYPSPLCCISFSKLMPITPPPTGSSRLPGHRGVLIAQPLCSHCTC